MMGPVAAILYRSGSPVRWSVVLHEDGMSAEPLDAETGKRLGSARSGSMQDIMRSIWRSEALGQQFMQRANE